MIYSFVQRFVRFVGILGMLFGHSVAAEISIDCDTMLPQVLTINKHDSVKWISGARNDTTIDGFDDQLKLHLTKSNNWSAHLRFDLPGTNVFRRYLFGRDPSVSFIGIRSEMIVIQEPANSLPDVTINSPRDGDIFNYGPTRTPVPLMATTTIDSNLIDRVEFVAGGSIVAVFTNAPYLAFDTSLPLGSHRLTARVVEKTGSIRESGPVNIRIQEVTETRLDAKLLNVRDQKLVMVSWVEIPSRGIMMRFPEINMLGTLEVSDTSRSGLRFWIEPIQTSEKAFFRIRERF